MSYHIVQKIKIDDIMKKIIIVICGFSILTILSIFFIPSQVINIKADNSVILRSYHSTQPTENAPEWSPCGLEVVSGMACGERQKSNVWVTMYSRADSCHNRIGKKCLTVIGQDTREGVTVACPKHIKLGSKINILGQIYICQDRYANWVQERQGDTYDIFTENYNNTIQFGKKRVQVEIL